MRATSCLEHPALAETPRLGIGLLDHHHEVVGMDPKLGLKALGETCIKPLPGRGAAHLARQDLEEDETLVPAAGLVVGS